MEYPVVLPWSDSSFFTYLYPFLQEKKIPIYGILHIGAHTCEEREEYNTHGISDEKILWIEGNQELCEKAIARGIPNIYQYLISDEEKDVTFHLTNFKASSSLFPLHVHKQWYPHIVEVEQQKQRAISLQSFFTREQKNPFDYNVWCLDIQGGEYDALKGAGDLLNTVDILFTEVNFQQMYESIPLLDTLEAFLKTKGFCLTHVKKWQNCWGDALFVRTSFLEA